jgi:hypothetical protein
MFVLRIVAERRCSCARNFGENDQIVCIRPLVVSISYTYRPAVIEQLAGHGLRPRPQTPPQHLRDAVRDLYLYEIRCLRADLLAGRILKPDYAGRVIDLRKRYPILSVPLELWVV